MVQRFEFRGESKLLKGFADSDWAGDVKTRKSTSGGAICWDGHCLKTWSTSQNVLALSSGEAELYAVTKAAIQVKGIMSMAKDFNIFMEGQIATDSNAALGIVHREGLGGRCRHIQVQYLWIQSAVKSKELSICKVPGVENPADLLTKCLAEEVIWRHMDKLRFKVRDGRAEKSSKLLTALTYPAGHQREIHHIDPPSRVCQC